jgi:nucleotide-binding universal stress UspA family protein
LARQLAAPDGVITLAHIYGPDSVVGGASSMSVLAERLRADLLVVGSTEHGLVGRVLMGEDARGGLSGAPCAVAIASRGHRHPPHELETLGVGYDAWPESELALAAARELAASHQATIWALQILPVDDAADDPPGPADWPDDTRLRVYHTIARLRGLGDDVEGDAVYGKPGEELVRFGEHLDLLLIGSRGYGPLGRLFHGGLSDYLSRHAPCPLLILPRGSAGTDEADVAGRAEEAVMSCSLPVS